MVLSWCWAGADSGLTRTFQPSPSARTALLWGADFSLDREMFATLRQAVKVFADALVKIERESS